MELMGDTSNKTEEKAESKDEKKNQTGMVLSDDELDKVAGGKKGNFFADIDKVKGGES